MRDRIHKLSTFNQPTEHFNLIDDEKTADAWVMPGGRAAVYSGILRYTQNETGHQIWQLMISHRAPPVCEMPEISVFYCQSDKWVLIFFTSDRHAAVLPSYFVENHIGNRFVVPTEMVRSL